MSDEPAAEIVRIRLPLGTDAVTVIIGALSRAWPEAQLVDGGRDYISVRLDGERSDWHPLEELDDD